MLSVTVAHTRDISLQRVTVDVSSQTETLGSLSILPPPVIPRQTDGRGGLSGEKGTHCELHRMSGVCLQSLGTAMVMVGGGASLVFSSSMAVGGYRSEPLEPPALTGLKS